MPLPKITITIDPPRDPEPDFLAAGTPPGAKIIRATWRFEHNGEPYGVAIDSVALPGTPSPNAPTIGRDLSALYLNAVATWDALHDQQHLDRAPRPAGTPAPVACTNPDHFRVPPLTDEERAYMTAKGIPLETPVESARELIGKLKAFNAAQDGQG